MRKICIRPDVIKTNQDKLLSILSRLFVCEAKTTSDGDCDLLILSGEISGKDLAQGNIVLHQGSEVGEISGSLRFRKGTPLQEHLQGEDILDSISPSGWLKDIPGTVCAEVDGHPVWVRTTLDGKIVDHIVWNNGDLDNLFNAVVHRKEISFLLLYLCCRLHLYPDWESTQSASIIIDDPYLVTTRYGAFNYKSVAKQCRENRFHFSIATVPLDLGLASAKDTKFLRQHADCFSAVIHGNDHILRELDTRDTQQASRVIGTALHRVRSFSRKRNYPIGEIFVPPHHSFSAEVAEQIFLHKGSGICSGHIYPWSKNKNDLFESNDPLHGWWPVIHVRNCPVIKRFNWAGVSSHALLSSLIGHPIILFCHHNSFLEKDFFPDFFDKLNRAMPLKWRSLPDILKSSYRFLSQPDGKHVLQVDGPRADVTVPSDYCNIVIQFPTIDTSQGNLPNLVIGEMVYSADPSSIYGLTYSIDRLPAGSSTLALKWSNIAWMEAVSHPTRFSARLRRFAVLIRDYLKLPSNQFLPKFLRRR